MKILFPYMARWHAVNWTRYHSLLAELGRRGHQIHVMQPPPLESAETNYEDVEPVPQPNVTLHDVPVWDAWWRRRMPFEKVLKKASYCRWAAKAAPSLIAKHDIDTVLLYNIPQYQFSSIPRVVQVFDFADDYLDMLKVELGVMAFPPVLRMGGAALRRMMTRAAVTFSVSHELARDAVGNVHVLPNGVSTAKAAGVKGVAGVANRGAPVVGFVGSFEYFIDFEMVLDAAAALPDVHFLLVGSGRDWSGVVDQVRERGLTNVELPGGVPHEDVFRYVRAMDVCLNTFRPIPVSHRACPIKLFEYLSQEKPVVSTRLDELKHIDSGFLYYADSGTELVDQIRHVLSHPEEARERATRGRQAVDAGYTWERIADRFEELVREAAASEGGPS